MGSSDAGAQEIQNHDLPSFVHTGDVISELACHADLSARLKSMNIDLKSTTDMLSERRATLSPTDYFNTCVTAACANLVGESRRRNLPSSCLTRCRLIFGLLDGAGSPARKCHHPESMVTQYEELNCLTRPSIGPFFPFQNGFGGLFGVLLLLPAYNHGQC